MKKPSLLSVFLLSTALLLVGASCYKNTTTNTVSNANTTTTVNTSNANRNTPLNVNSVNLNTPLNENTNTNSANSNSSVSTEAVTIDNFAFSPASVTVTKGTRVIWTNNDSASHTVTSSTGSELSSGTLGTGQTYSHTFATAGTYTYQCNFHPSMTGTVTVTE